MRSLVLFLLTASVFAQTSGTITGTILDLPGQPVANAPIQATHAATKAVFKATSSDKGGYTLTQLPPGTYELSVNAAGFNPFTQSGVAVAAGQTLRLDLHLFDFQLDTLGDGREFRVDQITAHQTPDGPAPRTPDGKPDLTGVWYTQRTVDPGKPEPLPWADALQKERVAKNVISPGAHCLTRGILAAGALFPYELVLTPKRLVMIFEDDTPSHRTVYLDGRGHPKNLDAKWMGHSIGHWEGDTLVVDTVGFNDETWLDNVGHPHTEMLHVVERLRRADSGHLEIEYTVEDPGAYSKPWVIKRVADLNTKDEIGEYVCIERDAPHMVGK
jgi:hypothetical protein